MLKARLIFTFFFFIQVSPTVHRIYRLYCGPVFAFEKTDRTEFRKIFFDQFQKNTWPHNLRSSFLANIGSSRMQMSPERLAHVSGSYLVFSTIFSLLNKQKKLGDIKSRLRQSSQPGLRHVLLICRLHFTLYCMCRVQFLLLSRLCRSQLFHGLAAIENDEGRCGC